MSKHYPKLVRDGKVAVLFSPNFGAGWYSWNEQYPECLFDPTIVEMVENKESTADIVAVAQQKWPEGYWEGARDLALYWLEEGLAFRIDEYDGRETVILGDQLEWIIA